MKTERRHELQTNVLADYLGGRVEAAKPYVKVVLGVAVAAAVLTGAYVVLSKQTRQEEELGWNRYFAAANGDDEVELAEIAKQYPSSPVGSWASLRLGDRHLIEGTDLLFKNRAEANEQLRDAVEHYQAASSAENPLVRQRAAFGLARAYESLRELEQARSAYESLVQQWPEGMYAEAAQRRLDDLSQKSTKEFYDWFAAQKPRPPLEDEPGEPGNRPPFEVPEESSSDSDLSLMPSFLSGEEEDQTEEPLPSTTEPATTEEDPAATQEDPEAVESTEVPAEESEAPAVETNTPAEPAAEETPAEEPAVQEPAAQELAPEESPPAVTIEESTPGADAAPLQSEPAPTPEPPPAEAPADTTVEGGN